jgi:hypothetical protein
MSEIVFRPNRKQEQALKYLNDSVTTELGYGGGAGGGKSVIGCFFLIQQCLAYPGTAWGMCRNELVNLRRTTLVTFHTLCQEFGLIPNVHFTHNQQTNVIHWSNGSDIFLLDLAYKPSDPLYTRLGSLELTGAFIDESAEVNSKAVDIVATRCGRRLNDKYNLTPKVLETFNPDKGHVYSRYYQPWKKGTLPAHRQFIKALATDNPRLPESYLTQLRNADQITKERLLFGNFEYDDDPTALMSYDAIQDLFTNVGEEGLPALSIDVARFGADRTVFNVWDGLISKKIIIQKGIDTQVVANKAKELEQEYRVPRSRTVVDSDGVGGGVADALKGCKHFVANATPLNPKSGESYANLKAQCGYMLAEKVMEREMAVHGASQEVRDDLAQELEQVKAKDPDKDNRKRLVSKDEVKERINRSPDIADTFLMRMMLELTATPSFGVQRPGYR